MDPAEFLSGFTERDWQTIAEAEPVRLAMIGLGWWTREEAIPAVQQADFCETTVVVSGSVDKAKRVAGEDAAIERGISYDEFHEGVAADAYDAIYVCTPNATHVEFVETAAELDKDVLCEKPMAASSDRAREMATIVEESDTTLMVAYRMQTEPAVRRARDMVDAGLIGDPIQVHGHMSDCLPELIPDSDQWRLDPDLSGGATLIDIGLYPLNTTRFVLGLDPVSVQANVFAEHEWFEDLDEHVTFQVEFEEGVSAACTVSHNAHNVSHLRIIGSEGEINVEPIFFPWDDRRITLRHGGTTTEFDFEQKNQMTEEFDYFSHCLVTDTDPLPDARHGLTDIEAIEAMYEAAKADERVELS